MVRGYKRRLMSMMGMRRLIVDYEEQKGEE